MKQWFVLLGLLFSQYLWAQQSVVSSGGNVSGGGGTVSYSIGQIVYTTMGANGLNGTVAQGVQQPYEISVSAGLEEANGINLMVSVYPNPTTENLQLIIDVSATPGVQLLNYKLFDLQGRLLETDKLEAILTSIGMSKHVPATYLLKVIEGNKEVKTFKIIKK